MDVSMARNSRLSVVRAEDHCNPCLNFKDTREIWPTISRGAGRHLPRCLACVLQPCQMGIVKPQEVLWEVSALPKKSSTGIFE